MTQMPRDGVVVGLDGSESSTTALDWAIEDARLRQRPLHLVHAQKVDHEILTGESPAAPGPGEGLLRDMRDRVARRAADLTVTTDVAHGAATQILTDLSHEADSVVVGASGRGSFGTAVLGSVALGVAMRAACPVAVVRGSTTHPADAPVVVGVDGSELSHRAVLHAFARADAHGAPLIAVHTWDVEFTSDPSASITLADWESLRERNRAVLDTALAPGRSSHPRVAVYTRFVYDYPSRALLEAAAGAQLLVVGSRGRSGLSGMLLGSVSQRLIQQAPCPVLVVRPPQT